MNLVTVDYLQQLTGQEYMYVSWVIRFLPIVFVLVVSNIIFMIRDVKKKKVWVVPENISVRNIRNFQK